MAGLIVTLTLVLGLSPAPVAAATACADQPGAAVQGVGKVVLHNCSDASSSALAAVLANVDANRGSPDWMSPSDAFLANDSWLVWVDNHTSPGILRGLWEIDSAGRFVGQTDARTGKYRSLIKPTPYFDGTAAAQNGYRGLHVEIWSAPEGTSGAYFWTYQTGVGCAPACTPVTTPSASVETAPTTLIRNDTGAKGHLVLTAIYSITPSSFTVETQARSDGPAVTVTGNAGGLLLLVNPACPWLARRHGQGYNCDSLSSGSVASKSLHWVDSPSMRKPDGSSPVSRFGGCAYPAGYVNGPTGDLFAGGWTSFTAPSATCPGAEDRTLTYSRLDAASSRTSYTGPAFSIRTARTSSVGFKLTPTFTPGSSQPDLADRLDYHFNHPEDVLRITNGYGSLDMVFECRPPGTAGACTFGSAAAPSLDWKADFGPLGPPASPVPYERPGIFRSGTWYLRDSVTTGTADMTFGFGLSDDEPVVGDWKCPAADPQCTGGGDGVDTVGVFRPGDSGGPSWHLATANADGAHAVAFRFANSGDVPVAGDWTGSGSATVGVFRPNDPAGTGFYLAGDNVDGGGTVTHVLFGAFGDIPVVGDWDGDGTTNLGVFRPSESRFYLRFAPCPSAPVVCTADVSFVPAPPAGVGGVPAGALPVAGNWTGWGQGAVGVFSSGDWWTYGPQDPDKLNLPEPRYLHPQYGLAGDLPVAGRWDTSDVRP